MRTTTGLTFVLCCIAAACGGENAAPAPRPPAAAPAPVPAPAPAPEAAKPVPEAGKPAPAAAARETKDATGHDWASHMGDIAFTFDSSAAAERSEKEGRALMLFFTTPT